MLVRINKYLADSGVASRRKAEELISEGRVDVNGKTIIELGFKIDPEKDIVQLDGENIQQKRHLYYLMNKPAGCVTTTSDEKKRKTVLDIMDIKEKIYPVGRLDYNTTGVLILTNDGDFTNLLTHPRNGVPRVYEVELDKPLQQEDKEKLLKGIYLETGKGRFSEIIPQGKSDFRKIEAVSVEGRNHFVKKMFGALGYTVVKLNRKSFAGVTADIPKGSYRILTQKEVENIIKKYGK
jgi:23S rRNA pseudouridine2605 synthase